MIRTVVDPNVFISAQISSSGPPARIARAADGGIFELVVSELLLSELHDVLMRPRFRRYMTEGEIERAVPDDPKDDYLVALTHASNADYLVSGDPHLTGAKSEIAVLTPREFSELLERESL